MSDRLDDLLREHFGCPIPTAPGLASILTGVRAIQRPEGSVANPTQPIPDLLADYAAGAGDASQLPELSQAEREELDQARRLSLEVGDGLTAVRPPADGLARVLGAVRAALDDHAEEVTTRSEDLRLSDDAPAGELIQFPQPSAQDSWTLAAGESEEPDEEEPDPNSV